MRFLESLSDNLFGFARPETAGERWHVRLLEAFVVVFTIKFCWEWALYLPKIGAVVLPLGVANYLDVSFMFGWPAYANAALVTVAGAVGFAHRWKYAYLVALLGFHLQYAARYSLGEISHGSNFVGMSVLAFAVAAMFFSDATQRRRFALGSLYFFFGLGYSMAGVCKLIGTGPNWPDGRHFWLWLGERQVDVTSKFGAFDPNLLQQLAQDHYALATLVLGFGLLVELFGVAMWWRRTRYLILPALIGMHLGVAISLNIWFEAYIYQLALMALPWPLVLDRLRGRALARRSDPLATRPV